MPLFVQVPSLLSSTDTDHANQYLYYNLIIVINFNLISLETYAHTSTMKFSFIIIFN
jgi:hypothetical protein